MITRTLEPLERYGIHVVGPSVADVVTHIGGWLFDHAMGGWDVLVFLDKTADAQALTVLGARVADCQTSEGAAATPTRLLTIAATSFERDLQARAVATEALEHHADNVSFWGSCCPADVWPGAGSRSVQLSAAARAFKAHALAAVRDPENASVLSGRERLYIPGTDSVLRGATTARWAR